MNARIKMSIICLIVVVLSMCVSTLQADDKDVEKLGQAREAADIARKEWERNTIKRRMDEWKQLEGLSIPDLAKRAISILVRHENPAFIVNKAIVVTEDSLDYGGDGRLRIKRPIWGTVTAPKDKMFWSMVYEEATDEKHHWWLEQHKSARDYRLIDYSAKKFISRFLTSPYCGKSWCSLCVMALRNVSTRWSMATHTIKKITVRYFRFQKRGRYSRKL